MENTFHAPRNSSKLNKIHIPIWEIIIPETDIKSPPLIAIVCQTGGSTPFPPPPISKQSILPPVNTTIEKAPLNYYHNANPFINYKR